MSQAFYKNILAFEYVSFSTFADKLAYLEKLSWFSTSEHYNNPWCLLNMSGPFIANLIYNSVKYSAPHKTVDKIIHDDLGIYIIKIQDKTYFISINDILRLWILLSHEYIKEYKSHFDANIEADAIAVFNSFLRYEYNLLIFDLPNVQ